jgi:hypothetical protein
MQPLRVMFASGVGVLLLLGSSCTFGSPGTFSINNASVDPGYSCPRGSNNVYYDIHASLDAHNGTSSSVTIMTVTAVMKLASVHGVWLQQVGSKFNAGKVSFGPPRVAAGADVTLTLIIPSSCTNGSQAGAAASYGEYSVTLTVTSSAGTHSVDTKNRHRITAA